MDVPCGDSEGVSERAVMRVEEWPSRDEVPPAVVVEAVVETPIDAGCDEDCFSAVDEAVALLTTETLEAKPEVDGEVPKAEGAVMVELAALLETTGGKLLRCAGVTEFKALELVVVRWYRVDEGTTWLVL